jgi:hypothetical protein
LVLDALDHFAGILALAHDDDTARDFALTIEFGNAAPHVGAELHRGDIADA